jgi:monofunctional biosynthetic peptidoglycan transglycosylase
MSGILRWFARLSLLLVLGLAALVLAYRMATPVSTLMLKRWVSNESIDRSFLSLERISANLVTAVVVSEDARFCRHNGVDWTEMREVMDEAAEEGPTRGASTITMQTAKNLFLWPSRSFIRKALEVPLALAIDAAWPKRRVLEVYLNIAEWGEGIFGAEAAARRYFHKSAGDLSLREAALLSAALPNPHLRDPLHPTRRHAALAASIMVRARNAGNGLDCIH